MPTASGKNQIGLLLLVVAVIGGVVGVGRGVGLGAASTLAALIALFCALAAFGGPLRSDLRLLAMLGPGMIVATSVPRLLAEFSVGLAIALVTVIVFVAGLVPALGARYATVGLGLGMATLFSYGMQLRGSADAMQIVGASVVAVAFVVVWRLLAGLRDPGKRTRGGIAAIFEADSPRVTGAMRTWLGDSPRRWSGSVLAAATRYQLIAATLREGNRVLPAPAAAHVDATLVAAGEYAGRLAEVVRARHPGELAAPALPEPGHVELPGGTRDLLAELESSLAAAREDATGRDSTAVNIPHAARRDVVAVAVAGTLSWRSVQLRHALRCAVGLLAALLLTLLRPHDPLIVAFLLTTFGILQVSWRDTLVRARQRVVGAVIGALVFTLALIVLPPVGLLPLALAAVLVGFWFMQSKPVVFSAAMVLMAVSLNATTRHLDPARTLVEYVVLIVVGVSIGLVFGFAAVPGVRVATLPERLDAAVTATRSLLLRLADLAEGPNRSAGTNMLHAGRTAATTQQDLATPTRHAPTPAEEKAIDEVGAALRGMAIAAAVLAFRPADRSTASSVLRELAGDLDTRETGTETELLDASSDNMVSTDDATALLCATVASQLHQLRGSLRSFESMHADVGTSTFG